MVSRAILNGWPLVAGQKPSAAAPVAPLSIAGVAPGATAGTAYSFVPAVTGGVQPYNFSLTGAFPTAWSFSASTGGLSGVTAQTGIFTGAIKVTDAAGSTATLPVSITVAAAAPVLGALTLSPSTGTVGTAYTGTVSGKTAGSTLSLTGAGSAGLAVSGSTINGTPTTPGAVNVVETLAGATGSPRTTSGLMTVAAGTDPPAGFTYLADPDGSRLTDADGAYLMEAA